MQKTKRVTFPREGYWMVVVRMQKDYVLMSEEGKLTAFQSLQQARDYFEIAYDKRHGSTYERSMSACIHYIFFEPRVINVKSKKELKTLVAKPPQSLSWWTVAGGMEGLLLDRKKGAALYKKATRVRLIKSEQEYVERYGNKDAEPG